MSSALGAVVHLSEDSAVTSLPPNNPEISTSKGDPESLAGRGPGLLVLLLSAVDTVPSGGDRLIVELVRRWPRQGGRVTVLTTSAGAHYMGDDVAATLDIKVLSVFGTSAPSVLWAYLIRTLTAPFVVWQVMARSRSGWVMSSSPYPPDIVPALIAKVLGARWIHSWQLAIPRPRLGYDPMGREGPRQHRFTMGRLASAIRQALSYASQNLSLGLARRWCNKLIVPTQLMASQALGKGFDHSQVQITNYGVDTAEVERAVAGAGSRRSQKCDGIFVGRFHAQKGLADLVAIWRQVQESLPSARLVVVGDGTGWEAAQLKHDITEFNDQTISLVGVLTGPPKFAAMSGSTVFLFPSHHESWGHVVLEAMAVGLPVVGYDLPSSREAFGDAMLFVPSFDVTAFADAVVRCLTHQEMRGEYRRRGLQMAEKYDWDSIAHRFAQGVLT